MSIVTKQFNVDELSGPILDLAVAHVQNLRYSLEILPLSEPKLAAVRLLNAAGKLEVEDYSPTRNWLDGGSLIQTYHIDLNTNDKLGGLGRYSAVRDCENVELLDAGTTRARAIGNFPLEAVCRAFVKSKAGLTIELMVPGKGD